MGNSVKPIYADVACLYFLNNINIFIGGINLLEYCFPISKNGKTTANIISNLREILKEILRSDPNRDIIRDAYLLSKNLSNNYQEIINLPLTTIHQIEKEEKLSYEISQIFYRARLDDVNITNKNLSIYQILYLIRDFRLGSNFARKIRQHPKITPLIISIIFSEHSLIMDDLRTIDPRSSNMRAYYCSLLIRDNDIISMVKDAILLRILLINRVFQLISVDVLNYATCYRKVFYL